MPDAYTAGYAQGRADLDADRPYEVEASELSLEDEEAFYDGYDDGYMSVHPKDARGGRHRGAGGDCMSDFPRPGKWAVK